VLGQVVQRARVLRYVDADVPIPPVKRTDWISSFSVTELSS
jgi:hypothetical protein